MTARVVLRDASLRYPVHSSEFSAKRFLLERLRRSESSRQTRYVDAVDGLNLEFRTGDRVGIVGRNGAGKSSLLRLVAGIYPPTRGSVETEGFLVPLFQLGLGFHPELSVEANIIQAGVILGHSPREIQTRIPEILRFAELEAYAKFPLKALSTGMAMRVAFTTATAIEPEILLLDEVFAGGDVAFRERAVSRLDRLIERTSIVVMVSHSASILRRLCTRAIWLESGRLRLDGDPEVVIGAYEQSGGDMPAAAV